jgi:hypothetical protein
LDLVYLMRDLDGPTSVGLSFHSQFSPPAAHCSQRLSSSLSTSAIKRSSFRPSLPTAPLDIPPPSPSLQGKAHLSSKQFSLNTHQWQTVPSRTKLTHSVPRSHISTYSRDVNKNKSARGLFADRSNYLSASEEEDNTNNSRFRVRRATVKSRQALMDAAIMYQKRNNKNRYGEVAFYYAERVCKVSLVIPLFCCLNNLRDTGERVETDCEPGSSQRRSRNGTCEEVRDMIHQFRKVTDINAVRSEDNEMSLIFMEPR